MNTTETEINTIEEDTTMKHYTIPGATTAERAKAVADWPWPVTTYHLPADWPADWPTDARLAAEMMATTIATREQYAHAERDINAGLRAKIAALELGLQTTREAFDELQKDYELTRELASRYMNERDRADAIADYLLAANDSLRDRLIHTKQIANERSQKTAKRI